MLLRMYSNGVIVGYNEKGEESYKNNLLDPLINEMKSKGEIDDNTQILCPLHSEPIKVADWFTNLDLFDAI